MNTVSMNDTERLDFLAQSAAKLLVVETDEKSFDCKLTFWKQGKQRTVKSSSKVSWGDSLRNAVDKANK